MEALLGCMQDADVMVAILTSVGLDLELKVG